MEKSAVKSKTLWGVLLTVLVSVAPFLGIHFTADDAALISEGIDQLIILATAVLAIYGRVRAESKLTFKLTRKE